MTVINKITKSNIHPLEQVDKINEIIDKKQDVILAGNNITFDYNWTVSSSRMTSDYYTKWTLATNGTKILAINSSGAISESIDNGETWQTITTLEVEGYFANWRSIIYDGTTFVALHGEGLVAIQNNDETWTVIEVQALSLSYNDSWESMTYDGTRLVCLSRQGKIGYSSSHGQTWNVSNYSLVQYDGSIHYWGKLTFNGNKYVALSNHGFISTTENILSSAWSTPAQKFNNEEDWNIIEYDGSKFLAVSVMGSTSTSVDGEIWTDIVQHNNLRENPYPYWINITFINGKCIIISGDGYLAYGVSTLSATGIVKKSGDTMTGSLGFNTTDTDSSPIQINNVSSTQRDITFNAATHRTAVIRSAVNNGECSLILGASDTNNNAPSGIEIKRTTSGTNIYGITYGDNDNSTKLATTAFVKKASSGQYNNTNADIVGTATSLNGSSELSYTLSLPNDGRNYMVALTGRTETGATSGNRCTLSVRSDLATTGREISRCRTRTASTVLATGTIWLPVSSTHKIYVARSTDYNGTFQLYMRGYYRIGVNS